MLNESIELEPSADAYATMVAFEEDPRNAMRHLQAALELDQSCSLAHVLMPEILGAQGRFEDAIDWIGKSHVDTGGQTRFTLALLHRDAGNLEKAEQLYRDALSLDPDSRKYLSEEWEKHQPSDWF